MAGVSTLRSRRQVGWEPTLTTRLRANHYRAPQDVAPWIPGDAIISAEGAGTMDIGLTMMPAFNARSVLNAATYGTMGVGLG
jgi:2-hydroxyacyl-CoA lyase 1